MLDNWGMIMGLKHYWEFIPKCASCGEHVRWRGKASNPLGIGRLFFPRMGHEEAMSLGRALFWKKCVGVLDGFVADKKETSLQIAEPVQIKARDLFWVSKRRLPHGEHRGSEADCLIIASVVEEKKWAPVRSPTRKHGEKILRHRVLLLFSRKI